MAFTYRECHLDILTYGQDREAVFPTRQSLGIMKAKLKGAETGHSLLKRKSEALTKLDEAASLAGTETDIFLL